MATSVIIPRQGQSVESCIITEWYKKEGERVETGDLLFAYETDKASFEEESSVEGTLLKIFFEAGKEVQVLSEVAVIGEPGEVIEHTRTVEEKDEPAKEEAGTEAQLEMVVDSEIRLEDQGILRPCRQ